MEPTDQDLLAATAVGDGEAFAVFWRRQQARADAEPEPVDGEGLRDPLQPRRERGDRVEIPEIALGEYALPVAE